VTDTKTPANLPGENVDAAVEVHRVQPGDTFALLARRYYGQERLADFLAQSNPQIANSRPLAIGEMVRIPPAPTGDSVPASAPGSSKLAGAAKPAHGVPLTAQSPAPNAPAKGATPEKANAAPTKAARTHRVRNGDTFYAIARDVLGDAGRWKELYELNRSRVGGDPDRLKVGQEIVLPEK